VVGRKKRPQPLWERFILQMVSYLKGSTVQSRTSGRRKQQPTFRQNMLRILEDIIKLKL
jgi:hypothetical protein